jgi:hypothetical protein
VLLVAGACVAALMMVQGVQDEWEGQRRDALRMDTEIKAQGKLHEEESYSMYQHAFESWLSIFERDYVHDVAEMKKRLGIFAENAKKIEAHNAVESRTFDMALNEFADLTFEEFASTKLGMHLGLGGGLRHREEENGTPFMYQNADNVPSSIDWRDKGAVTPVKNQGQCGSCWAFSTTGAIEGINQIMTGKLVSLSEQQLVSCDTSRDAGCGGGLMDFAFEYVVKNGGIDTEEDYGYWAWGLPCQTRREEDRPAVTIDGYEDVPPNNAEALKKAVANQPVSVGICASSALQFYSSGVLSEESCCQDLNHGVLVVGYKDKETDSDGENNGGYWLVKNSWGSGWGERGYFKLSKQSSSPSGTCGVYQAASYPTKHSHSNPEVPEICGIFGFTECPLHQSCVCNWSFFGFFCLNWGCAA